MELTLYRGRTVKWTTSHHDGRTNAVKAVVIELKEGNQLMVAVDVRHRNSKLDMFVAPPGIKLPWPTDPK